MGIDFSGWATKNNLKCGDGRVIRTNAFATNDGKRVPLVWNHQHNSPDKVIGHALLTNKPEGVWADCEFNNSESAKSAKEAVAHGDVTAMSIWANNLEQVGTDVIHGIIREVSLVLAGCNPGAFIESVMAHGEPMEDGDDDGIIYTGEDLFISHADLEKKDESKEEDEKKENDDKGETVVDVINTLSEKQKKAVAIVIGQAITDAKKDGSDDKKKEDEEMKHNLFADAQNGAPNVYFLSHSEEEQIIADAKESGSLRKAFEAKKQSMALSHSVDTTGMTVATGQQTYGINDVDMLFPDYKNLNNPPEFISRDMGWVQKVMNGVHRTPFSKIKSTYANITEDDARARGYIKGKMKKEEFFTTLKRTTDAQTIYKKQKLDRDDVTDITDFDVIAWIRSEMRLMLNEEIARAILIGDGRASDSDDKIKEDRIRPIVKDVALFNIKVDVTPGTDDAATAKNMIDKSLRSRKAYKGSGNPTLFTTETWLTEMLLLEDKIGHKLYKTETELATALRVSAIVTVEPMEQTKVDGKDLLGVIVNLSDYNVGTNKGGEINMFDDFDIDFNQYKYLLETRFSGALIKPYSAITLLKGSTGTVVTPPPSGSGGDDDDE